MTSFRAIWERWHIYGVRNPRTFAGDGDEHRLLDGIEDLVRPSMRLRALSAKALRAVQLENRWANDELESHMRGDHDPAESGENDVTIYEQLLFLDSEDWAAKLIPEHVLAQFDYPPSSRPQVR